MAKKLPNSINLLDPVFAPDDIWEKTYTWVFTVGQYILVLVEIVVLAVFISRFFLDRSNNDLTDDINNRVETLSSPFFRNSEIKYVNFNALLNELQLTADIQEENSKLVSSVLESIPSNLEMLRFSYGNSVVSMAFIASDFDSIQKYERILKDNPAYSDISVRLNKAGEVDSDIDFSVSFQINSELLRTNGS